MDLFTISIQPQDRMHSVQAKHLGTQHNIKTQINISAADLAFQPYFCLTFLSAAFNKFPSYKPVLLPKTLKLGSQEDNGGRAVFSNRARLRKWPQSEGEDVANRQLDGLINKKRKNRPEKLMKKLRGEGLGERKGEDNSSTGGELGF